MTTRNKRITADTTAKRIDFTMFGRTIPQGSVSIRNRSSVSVFIGGESVTVDDGYELGPGEAVGGDVSAGDAIYVVANTNGNRCDVLQLGGA